MNTGIRLGRHTPPYALFYFSENSSFLEDYSKLPFFQVDARYVLVPNVRFPFFRLTEALKQDYKKLGLFAFNQIQRPPKGKNIFIDLTHYERIIDDKYKFKNYRQRGALFLDKIINYPLPGVYKKIFLYSIDLTKPFNKFINTKAYHILTRIKEENFNFDEMLMFMLTDSAYYRRVIKDKETDFARLVQYFRRLRPYTKPEDFSEELEKRAENLLTRIKGRIKPDNFDKFKIALMALAKDDSDIMDKIEHGQLTDDDIMELASLAMLAQTLGSVSKAKKVLENIPKNKIERAIRLIDEKYADELLVKYPAKIVSTDIFSEVSRVDKLVQKSPQHLFEKRKIDFETNLKTDTENAFKVLETKDIPIYVENVEIKDHPVDMTELRRSEYQTITVKLKTASGSRQTVHINIPKLQEDGTFIINGEKKVLLNQMIQNPITFPKPYDSKFESSFSAFHIWVKFIRTPYLEIYMGSYKGPFLPLLFYSFGFFPTLKRYNIEADILSKKIRNIGPNDMIIKVAPKNFIHFKNIDTDAKKYLINSLKMTRLEKLKFDQDIDITSKDFWGLVLNKYTKKVNTSYAVSNTLENIVDPIVRQVLVNMKLPSQLPDIMEYMTLKVVTGFTIDRNDINNQRVRNSEIIVHLLQKRILAAYTEYKQQVLAGNTDAKLNIGRDDVISSIINVEIAQSMEYANPIEEISILTRVSPIGGKIGGIPDKRAIQEEARNVHPSYFGNIDPLDTPENANVGIIQHLTLDASLSGSRGLFDIKNMDDKLGLSILSPSSAMVPFIENNDGARVMFSNAQARQTLPLKNPNPPIVRSGYESILAGVLSDNFVIRAPNDGKIVDINEGKHLIVFADKVEKKQKEISIAPKHLKSGSGRNTLSVFRPTVRKGEIVKRDQIIAEGSCMKDGVISLGRTVLAAFMPYKGYNFEDGIVISSSLAQNQSLTSLHGIEEEVVIGVKDRIISIANIGDYVEKGKPLIVKTIGELDELLGYSTEEDETIELMGGDLVKKSPGGRVVDIEVFANTTDAKFKNLLPLIEKTNKKYGRTPHKKFKIDGVPFEGLIIKFYIEQELHINVGDKLTNRYGGKGVISLIEDENKMPVTPWGEKIEIILNPIGVISRMNMGQIYELYTGLIARFLGRKILQIKNKDKVRALLEKVISPLDKTEKQVYTQSIIASIKSMNQAEYLNFLNHIKELDAFPITIVPFKGPKYQDIIKSLKILGLQTKYKLRLPEYNAYTIRPVPVGYMYYYKLEHIAELKLHARSTGPKTGKTKQPTQGKRREGGQRFGEGDVYTLLSYNAKYTLSEFMGPLSDDVVTKEKIISEMITQGNAKFEAPKTSPSKELLASYFISMMLEEST